LERRRIPGAKGEKQSAPFEKKCVFTLTIQKNEKTARKTAVFEKNPCISAHFPV
jgi:hypothetical protein